MVVSLFLNAQAAEPKVMDRPRRTLRPTARSLQVEPQPLTRTVRRKASPEPVDPKKQLKTMLESSKSDLVSLDMHDIINKNTWEMLSEDSRKHLIMLLPPTAFLNSKPVLAINHPPMDNTMIVDEDPLEDSVEDRLLQFNPAFFNDSHFLAAERTFQDHLYLNWFSGRHRAKVIQFQEGVANGTLSAPWKDQVWERENAVPVVQPSSFFSLPNDGRAGNAAEIKLYVLVKNGIIRTGDVIAYKHGFVSSDVSVEKDSIIQEINPTTYAVTALTLPGSDKDLPASLLAKEIPSDTPQAVQPVTFTSPTMLETALLDLDGRIERGRRPNGNAWKSFTIWRWRPGAEYDPYDSRGGRENHGTLFYLRACYSH